MKKKKNMLAILLIAFSIITSCQRCEIFPSGEGPTITWKQNLDTVIQGEETIVIFDIEITPDLTAGNYIEEFCIDTDTVTLVSEFYNDSSMTRNYTFQYQVKAEVEKGDLSFTLTATDNQDATCVEMATIVVAEKKDVDPENDFITKTCEFYYNSESLTFNNKMMFVCTDEGLIADATDLNADLAFAWQNDFGYSICSPNAKWIKTLFNFNGIVYNTADKKTTKIMLYTGGSFEDITDETLQNLVVQNVEVSGGGNGLNHLQNDDLVAFETQSGQKGIIKVVNNSKVLKQLFCEIKYQTENSGNIVKQVVK